MTNAFAQNTSVIARSVPGDRSNLMSIAVLAGLIRRPKYGTPRNDNARTVHKNDKKRASNENNKYGHCGTIAFGWLIVGFVGFLDATYLSIEHFRNAAPHCLLLKGCDVVTTSKYAVMFGVPVALMGAIYYCLIIILSFAYLDSRNTLIRKIIIPLTGAGFVASLYFVYLQFFVIRALCVYCMGSATTGTILFVLSLLFIFHCRRQHEKLCESKKA